MFYERTQVTLTKATWATLQSELTKVLLSNMQPAKFRFAFVAYSPVSLILKVARVLPQAKFLVDLVDRLHVKIFRYNQINSRQNSRGGRQVERT